MGTQSSYGGPKDKIPLLPDWALQPPDQQLPPEEEPEGEAGDDQQAEVDGLGDSAQPSPDHDAPPEIAPPKVAPPAPSGNWQSASRSLGACAKRGSGLNNRIRTAARSYVRALGGSKRAARSSASARAATASLGRFLSTVATQGIDAALASIRLTSFVGKDVQTVFAAIVNAISPEGSSREDVAVREAISEALARLYDELIPLDGSVASLSALTDTQIDSAIVLSVTAYIYRRWINDLGLKLEQKAITAAAAVKLEREMKMYVKEAVKLDLSGKKVREMDWKGKEGREFVEKIYQDAFSFIGATK